MKSVLIRAIFILSVSMLPLLMCSKLLYSIDRSGVPQNSNKTLSYIDITGRVVGSDSSGRGLPEVKVALSGQETYNAISDDEGYFVFYQVSTDEQYVLSATKEGYLSFKKEVTISEGDTDLGVIVLLENAYQPTHLVAKQNDDDTEVELNWNRPTSVTNYYFDFESGEEGWTSGAINGLDLWEHGTPSQVYIKSAHSGDNAFMTRLLGAYDNESNTWLQSPELNFSFFSEPRLSVWLNIYCENNFDAMILECSVDGGQSWDKIRGDTGFYNNQSTLGPLAPPKWSGRVGVWDQYSTSLPELSNQPSVYLRFRFQSDETISYEGVAIDDISIFDDSLQLSGGWHLLDNCTRELEEYLVYRFAYENLNKQDEWVELGIANDTLYVDDSWQSVPDGFYGYAVVAKYTDNNKSMPTVSNWVGRGLTGNFSVNVFTDIGDSAEGSKITLTYKDSTPDGKLLSYNGITGAGIPSTSFFKNILLGKYKIEIEKPGFETKQIDEYEIVSGGVLEIEIVEIPLPPRKLVVSATESLVKLTWQPPLSDEEFRKSNRSNRGLLNYNVYRSDEKINETPVYETNFLDENVENGIEYTYYVTASYTYRESEPSNKAIATPGANQFIRIGREDRADYTLPMNFWYKNSISQTIYYRDEINNGGAINEISYFYNFSSEVISVPIKVWMVETSVNNLVDRWIPSSEMTLVFDQAISFSSGEGKLTIPLEDYFFYSGTGNLVVMIQRLMDPDYYASTDKFYYSITPDYLNRTRYIYSDDDEYDPEQVMGGTINNRVPNTELSLITAGLGSLSGKVQDSEGRPLAGVRLTIEGTDFSVESNSQGFYKFQFIHKGTHRVIASKHGFFDAVIEGVEVKENEITTLNLELTPLKKIVVFGKVVGSDNVEVGLSGAFVSMNGYDEYTTETSEDGRFEVGEVYAKQSYVLKIERHGYDSKELNIDVEDNNLDLGNIVVTELAVPPTNVFAEIIEENTNVKISWSQQSTLVARRELRALTGYIVFRLKPGDENERDKWKELATIGENFFIDKEWSRLPNGAYRYAVVAIYTNNRVSEPSFSNQVVYTEKIRDIVNLTAEVVGQQVELKWEWESTPLNVRKRVDSAEGAVVRGFLGFQIYRGSKIIAEGIEDTQYIDTNVPVGDYTYSVIGLFDNGTTRILTIDVTIHLKAENEREEIQLTPFLAQNYPNPFNAETTITYSVKEAGYVIVQIYNIRGEKVRQLVNEKHNSGLYRIVWDGKDDFGSEVVSGIYFCRLQMQDFRQVMKMIMLR